MVLADATDEKNILHQYEVMIDIAFVNDFELENIKIKFISDENEQLSLF